MLRRVANHTGWLTTLYSTNLCLVALVFAIVEDRHYPDALWWGIVTSTTTGYGDIFPTSLVGRLAGGELMLTNILLVAMIVSRVMHAVTEDLDKFSHDEQERIKQHLAAIDADGDRIRADVLAELRQQRDTAAREADELREQVRRLEAAVHRVLERA